MAATRQAATLRAGRKPVGAEGSAGAGARKEEEGARGAAGELGRERATRPRLRPAGSLAREEAGRLGRAKGEEKGERAGPAAREGKERRGCGPGKKERERGEEKERGKVGPAGERKGKRGERNPGNFSDSRRRILRTKRNQIKSDEFELRSKGIDSISDRESDRSKVIHAIK